MTEEKSPEQWYRLVSVFDGEHKKNFEINGEAYVLGRINEQVFVKAPADLAPSKRVALGQWLEAKGFGDSALVVPDYVDFACIRPCDSELAGRLTQHVAEQAAREAAEAERVVAEMQKAMEGGSASSSGT